MIEKQIPAYLSTLGEAARKAVKAGFLSIRASNGTKIELRPLRRSKTRGWAFQEKPDPRIYLITKSGKVIGFYKLES